MAKDKNKKFYITASIAYVNAPPHIGYVMELIQADALARYHRLLGEDVFFLSGTDENSEKINQSAIKNQKDPLELINENAEKFKSLYGVLNISNSDFIRTTDQKRHWPSAQEVWSRVKRTGDIYKKKYGGYYCVGCEAFLTEKDLIGGKCPNHQKPPEWREEENYFFRWSKYQKFLEDFLEKNKDFVVPSNRFNEMREFLKRGLEDISISRAKEKIPWGVPVPDDGSQVMYVWFDALTNYLSGLGFPADNAKVKRYWPADIHLVGKDIDRWHSLLWPAMLESAGLQLPKQIFVHGFITSKGQKMSKTIGNVINPYDVIEKYKSIDALRYYLLKEISSNEDGDFTYERFEEVYKSDLQNGLGNFVSRALTMIEKYFGGKIPAPEKEALLPGENPQKVEDVIVSNIGKMDLLMGKFEINKVLSDIINKNVAALDGYIDYYKPFKLIKEDKEKTASILYNCAEAIRIIAWSIRPFMPEASDKIFAQLFAVEEERSEELSKTFQEAQKWGGLKPGTKIKKGEGLFSRLD